MPSVMASRAIRILVDHPDGSATPTDFVGGAFRPLNQTIHSLDGPPPEPPLAPSKSRGPRANQCNILGSNVRPMTFHD